MVVTQNTAQSISSNQFATMASIIRGCIEQTIVNPLVIAFQMIVCHGFRVQGAGVEFIYIHNR